MCGRKDCGTQEHGASPSVFLAKALKEKAPEKYFLHERGENNRHKEKPPGRFKHFKEPQD
jgi:hypothetical protein